MYINYDFTCDGMSNLNSVFISRDQVYFVASVLSNADETVLVKGSEVKSWSSGTETDYSKTHTRMALYCTHEVKNFTWLKWYQRPPLGERLGPNNEKSLRTERGNLRGEKSTHLKAQLLHFHWIFLIIKIMIANALHALFNNNR